ncbi:conserved hypothetical protein [Shewanella halifaxensis HAW-EB4]|uniref:Membrane anchored protein in chemotaxis locus n=1 Tax=Shewanella halifaxensis (strain HAW-EB4) TaxID=458817 RepID=B0TMG7_SHEHH|nr:hypothetical protein [Shewanella halifaxensis]ABZ76036.1 conserved hypothetical protein [Shewanella halifaxensis HAW-EB4]
MAKMAFGQNVILQRGEMNTLSLLLLFLLSIASFTFGSLYFESQHKNKLLSSEVQKLKNSQVLLMVPDEQAEVMANWMANNPHFVQSFVDKAKQGEATVLPIGPGAHQGEQSQLPLTSHNGDESASVNTSEKVIQGALVKPPEGKQALRATLNTAPAEKVTIKKSEPVENEASNDKSSLAEPSAQIEPSAQKEASDIKQNGNHNAKSKVIKTVTVIEGDDGVKLISLPHGGIRVTTREPEG